MSEIDITVKKLELCATPCWCYSCPEAMNTRGCDRETMRVAARMLRELEADRARLLHALGSVVEQLDKVLEDADKAFDNSLEVTAREESGIDITTQKLELREASGSSYDWQLLEMAADKLSELEADRARLIHALSRVDVDCAYCAHKDRHAKECVAADCDFERCRVAECPCRECNGKNWTWNGGGGDE